jgi:APA family basic amino acid/polyamine antiporter
MADKVHISREVPGPASTPSGEESSHQFGLTAAMALIVGSIIGVGIFNLPTSLAVYGPITLVGCGSPPRSTCLGSRTRARSRWGPPS